MIPGIPHPSQQQQIPLPGRNRQGFGLQAPGIGPGSQEAPIMPGLSAPPGNQPFAAQSFQDQGPPPLGPGGVEEGVPISPNEAFTQAIIRKMQQLGIGLEDDEPEEVGGYF